MEFSKIPIERYAAFLVVAAIVLLALYFFAVPILLAVLPFLLAFAAAYVCRPLAIRLHRLTRIPVSGLCVFLVFFFVLLVLLLLYFGMRAALGELLALAARLEDGGNPWQEMVDTVSLWWNGMVSRFSFLSPLGIGENGEGMLTHFLENAGNTLGEYAVRLAGKIAAALPAWIIFVMVSLVSAFYFARDMGKMRTSAERVLPPRVLGALLRLKNSAWYAGVGYLRAYLLLLLFIFGMLLVGFLLLHVPYAILLAAGIAVLDFLPVIGVGTVLIPWGTVEMIRGNTYLGIGLLLLFAAISVARQFLEPKLIGHQLGMHPLLTLVAMYVGLRLFGFAGLFLLPPLCLVLRQAFFSKTADPGNG